MSALEKEVVPDFATARFHMVEGQLRPNKVTDRRILDAMGSLPRELFLPPLLAGVAYRDEDTQITSGRYLMEPMILARLLQEANIKSTDRVLDIAPATGYSTAVLASMAKEVVAVESDPVLVTQAVKNLPFVGITNAAFNLGSLAQGWEATGPYDVILINGSVEIVPDAILAQLAEGGRLMVVLQLYGPGHMAHWGEARLYEKRMASFRIVHCSTRIFVRSQVLKLPKNSNLSEIRMSNVPAINVEQLRDLIQSVAPPLVLDVREQREYDIAKLPHSKLMPLGDLPARYTELPKDQPIVVHCHHGGRSARATAFLLQNGFTDVVNLSGGIQAWSERIDPAVKTYT